MAKVKVNRKITVELTLTGEEASYLFKLTECHRVQAGVVGKQPSEKSNDKMLRKHIHSAMKNI